VTISGGGCPALTTRRGQQTLLQPVVLARQQSALAGLPLGAVGAYPLDGLSSMWPGSSSISSTTSSPSRAAVAGWAVPVYPSIPVAVWAVPTGLDCDEPR
jgi:hypothetical protein